MKLLFKILFTLVLPVAILGGAAAGAFFFMATAPKTERTEEKRLAPAVEVIDIANNPMARVVEVFGSVRPAQEVSVSLEVSGRIVSMHPALEPGGVVKAGDVLVKVDPEEFELAVGRAEAARQEAVAALEVEQGRQRVAEREWELFGKDLPDAELGRELMLREPQMEQAKARIASAEADVARAKLDLKRTELRAPFDALVLSESIDIGQHVSTNANIATLVGTNTFWVEGSVAQEKLGAILDAATDEECEVRVYTDVKNQTYPPRTGRLVRHMGRVDPDGRMALVLIEVDDPLALLAENDGAAPLPLNTYVRAEIDAGMVPEAIAIPLLGLRENEWMWVADAANLLQVRKAEVVWQQEDHVAVRNVFEPGDRLIVSPLEHALPGMEVRPLDPRTGTEPDKELPAA